MKRRRCFSAGLDSHLLRAPGNSSIPRMTSPQSKVSFLFALFALFVCWVPSPALARGAKAEKTTVEEDPSAHSWKLKLILDFGSAPDRDIVPMVFSFKQTATYERALTDESKDKAVTRTVPMANQVPNNSEQEVGFSDSETGKRFAVTKFPITLRRKDDFEAGEYELTIKAVGGATLGTVRLQLKGDNKAIDRRSLNFGESVSAPKKKSDAASKEASASAHGAAEDQGPDLSNIPDVPKALGEPSTSDQAPAPVAPKQGGCGCEVAGVGPLSAGVLPFAVAFALALGARRRRS